MTYSIRHTTDTNNVEQTEILCSHSNHRGDIIARSDSTGSLTFYAVYEAYGTRPFEWTKPDSLGNPDRQYANTKDEETALGLLNEGMRYRDLYTGTFLTRDPIGYADGPNIYCYVHCNPITRFDPLGLTTLNKAQAAIEKAQKERDSALEEWQQKKDSGGFKSERQANNSRQKIIKKYNQERNLQEGYMRAILGMSAYMNAHMNKDVDPFELDTESKEYTEAFRHLYNTKIMSPEKMFLLQMEIVATELSGMALIQTVKKLKVASHARRFDKMKSTMENISKIKGGGRLGTIKGNPNKVFKSLIKGGEMVNKNQYRLKDGTMVTKYISTTTKVVTIQMNRGGKIIKFRIVQ